MTRTFFRTLAVTLGALGALIALPSAAMADTVTMTVTSAGTDTSHGVYISPYYASIGGGPSTAVICDDFTDDVYIPESWTATVYAGSGVLSATRMATLSGFTGVTPTTLNRAYDAVAYLALQLPGADAASRAMTSFAIWDIFLDGAVNSWLGNTLFYSDVHSKAQGALTNASVDLRSILTIYSAPTSGYSCGGYTGGTCPTTPPQEFVFVNTPEASAPAILAFNLLGLLGVVFCVRRRLLRNAGIPR